MKKLLLSLVLFGGTTGPTLGVGIDDSEGFTYLTFETAGGAKVSVPVESLTMTVAGNVLSVGKQSFTLSELRSMYFSQADETTGIKTITAQELEEVTAVYDLKGRRLEKSQLKKGVYVVKSSRGTYKIAVK